MCLAVWLVVAGCGSSGSREPQRFVVSGTVTLDGKPLASGMVFFKTVATGAIDTFDVKDGRFEGKAQPGDRRVEICAYEPIKRAGPAANLQPQFQDKIQRNTIPPQYNDKSTLTAKVRQDAPNEFSFELSSR
jgi:hypothetical protein